MKTAKSGGIAAIFLAIGAFVALAWGILPPFTAAKAVLTAIFGALAVAAASGFGGLKRTWPLLIGLALMAAGGAYLSKITTGLALLFLSNLFFALYFILSGKLGKKGFALGAAVMIAYVLYFVFGMMPQLSNVSGALQLSNNAAGGIFFLFFLAAALVPAVSFGGTGGAWTRFFSALSGFCCAMFYFILAEGFFGGRLTLNPYFYPVFTLAILLLSAAGTLRGRAVNCAEPRDLE